ncbi:MAG: selenocysteine-specific translation elongation factor [Calditrichaeota bacterium]|nr:selenocysteine-specific translation elongation factor [Calditrichota bacterium]MCB9366502.1 selenocysteine-specific translation elongation factor [Calditrichota bacterium]MCB9391240.1 selenocysteine-specific translation elongation factor [Calditrichota bacterium]
MPHVIVGTAGHIDHGKSSLVRALTGTDPDRLPEEKRRQITIDLGFAFLNEVAAIIDVPGHEKFIHNMVAGAATIDYALLVIAADDGIMPQTREHLHILRLLGLQNGAIVLTKCGIVQTDWLALVADQVKSEVCGTFLEDAPIFEVDSLQGTGIDALRTFLVNELPKVVRRRTRSVLRIPLDRVFTVHGHGTVVTGTVLSGEITRDMRVQILPGGAFARVKQLQSNARERTRIEPGMRAALNLVTDSEILRGQTITTEGSLAVTKRLVISFRPVPGTPQIRDRQRVRLLIGTQEVMGRFRLLKRNSSFDLALLLLDEEVVASWGDCFIVRRYSPLETLGGGEVLDVAPILRGARDKLGLLNMLGDTVQSDFESGVRNWAYSHSFLGVRLQRIAQVFSAELGFVKKALESAHGEWLLVEEYAAHREHVNRWQKKILDGMARLHKEQSDVASFPLLRLAQLVPGLPDSLLASAVSELVARAQMESNASGFSLPGKSANVDPKQAQLLERVLVELSVSKFAPPSANVLSEKLNERKSDVERVLVLATRQNLVVRLGVDIFFERQVFADAIAKTVSVIKSSGSAQVSELSKILNSSRKYVVPFLEYLDSKGITERQDNLRVEGRNFSNFDSIQ